MELYMISTEKVQQVFELFPTKKSPIGFVSIPHSGEYLPEEFKPYLVENTKDLMQDVDFRVHELIDIETLQNEGISVVKADIIRTAIDLNRKAEDAVLNWKSNSKGKKIVIKEPEQEKKDYFMAKYYLPYYEMLKTQYFMLQEKSHLPSFIDLHSMPSEAEEYHLKINPHQDKIRPDFCLSDYRGKTCKKEYILSIQEKLSKHYDNVTINNPYFGGHVTQHMDRMYKPLNNIQIEISRGIYMDEKTQTLTENSKRLKSVLTSEIVSFFQEQFEKHAK